MPQVIEAGLLYAAAPPLYSVLQGKKRVYFPTKLDFAKYIQQVFNKSHVLEQLGKNGKKLSPAEVAKLYYQNIDYAYTINTLASIFAVDAGLLEAVLFEIADVINFGQNKDIMASGFAMATAVKNAGGDDEAVKNVLDQSIIQTVQYSIADLDIAKLRKSITKQFRFMKVEKKNNTIMIHGEVNEQYQYIFINDYFINNCFTALRMIMNIGTRYYKMDGVPVSIYYIINAFDHTMPSVKRYKGLGEMNASEAAESTLSVENRTLIRYTIESAKEEINSIRYIDSNISNLLNGVTITRQDVE